MGDKLDFMSELAKDVEAKKHGQTSSFGSINDFVPKEHHPKETEFDKTQDYEQPSEPVSSAPVSEEKAPASAVEEGKEEAPEEEKKEEKPKSFEEIYEDSGNNNKDASPASFQEEVRVKVEKPKMKLSPVGIGVVAALIALIGFLVWFFFIRANIVLPDFTGKTLSDVSAWAKQNKIANTSIAPSYEFSMEYDNDVVMSQTPAGGTRVKTDTPINLVVSKGADPDEEVAFPSDLKSMTYDELTAWKNENKLTKTKITTEYNTAVPSGEVISYELKNTSENDFRRNSTLTIKTSKGPAPAGQVTVENYVNKTWNEAVNWANSKKVHAVKQEVNSDTVETNYIISQSPASGQAMNEGETITFVVSKGKGVKIPNLVGYTKEQLEAWKSAKVNSSITVVTKSVYNEAPAGSVIAQSVSPGTVLDSGDVLLLTISLYMPILETNSRAWIGKDYLELRAWCDDVNSKGVDIQAGEWGEDFQPIYSDEYPTPGQVIKYACYYGTSDIADGCGRPLTANSRINYQRSLGPKTVKNASSITTETLASLQTVINYCDTNRMTCIIDETSLPSGVNIRVTYNGISRTNKDSFQDSLLQGTYIHVEYDRKVGTDPTPDPVKNSVLVRDNIQSLNDILTFCNTNSIKYTIKDSLSEGDPNVRVTITFSDGHTETYDSDGSDFQVLLSSKDKMQIQYKKLPAPTPSASSESSGDQENG